MPQSLRRRHVGIVAHSAEGAALCFLATCHEGERRLGPHFHPDVTLDIAAMGESMADWEKLELPPIAERLARSVARLAAAGAEFVVCPDNTAHLALEASPSSLPLPALHIAEVVADEAARHGRRKVGLLGTRWTMEGAVYPRELHRRSIESVTPPEPDRAEVQSIIFDELVRGLFTESARNRLVKAIDGLARQGCDAVVLGCTELPIVLDDGNSPLPTLDSTRLLARAAVDVALGAAPLPEWRGGPR